MKRAKPVAMQRAMQEKPSEEAERALDHEYPTSTELAVNQKQPKGA